MNEVTIFGRNAGHISAKQPVVSLSSGDRHCIIGCTRKVYSIGANDWGQLGLGHNDAVSGIQRVQLDLPDDATVKQVCAGRDHSIILLTNGDVYGFGANNDDQIGVADSFVPVKIPFERTIEQVGCGSSFTVALDTDGNLYGLGSNEDGQLGLADVESIANAQRLISSVKSFSCGYHHLAVISFDGKVRTTGDNEYGQLGRDGDTKTFNEVTINDEFFVPRLVSCGGQVTFVAGEKTSLYAAGTGDRGQLGAGVRQTLSTSFIAITTLARFEFISSGFSSTSALCERTKQIYVWGSSKNGVLGSINQNLYTPTPLKNLTKCQARLVSTGGWNTIVCHGEKSATAMSDETTEYGARARRRAQRTLTATMPPLSRTLENTELNELKSVIRAQSLKRSAEFQLCKEEDLKQYERMSTSVDTTVTQSVEIKTEVIDEDEEEEEETEYETETEDEGPVEADVTVSPPAEKPEKVTEESAVPKQEQSTGERHENEENNETSQAKQVKINEDKNDEKVYSDWGEDEQVPVFKSLRRSFRKLFKSDKNPTPTSDTPADVKPAPEVEEEEQPKQSDATAPTPDQKSKKSKLCTIL